MILRTLGAHRYGRLFSQISSKRDRVERVRPGVVIDPITALEKSGGLEIAGVVAERTVALLKSRGISALFTAVTETQRGELEATPLRVSTIADTWINLSFANQGAKETGR